MKYFIFICFISLLGCSKEPIKEFYEIKIEDYFRKYLPNKLNETIEFQMNSIPTKSLSFKCNGFYFNSPVYKNKENVDFSERFYWEMTSNNSIDSFVVSIDSVRSTSFKIRFVVTNLKYKLDSQYSYILFPMPKDSIYQGDFQKYYTTLKVGNKEYKNCFELKGGSISSALYNSSKLIYNNTDGILYFEGCNGSKFTIKN